MKRRQLLSMGALGMGSVLMSQCAQSQKGRGHNTSTKALLRPLERITSNNGLLELSLTAHSQIQTIAHKSVNRLVYNARSPGPIVEVRAGDLVRLTLISQLDRPTNLHYHGLHISPEIDNVFREIAAGSQTTYEFQIPKDHPAITGWYHPHYHLNVAPQVFNGLAGPLIVRGELDKIPELQDAKEEVLVLQDFEPDLALDGEIPALVKKWGREGSILLVNGQQNPIIELPENGLLRLRLINSSASKIYQLHLLEHPCYLIATDRGSISAPVAIDRISLSPGERVDLLIPGSREPGEYKIVSLPHDRGIAAMIASMKNKPLGAVAPFETTLATLRYVESEYTEQLPVPTQLVPVEPLADSKITREFVLDHGIDHSAGSTGFLINGQSFQMNQVNLQVQLGQVEDWRITNKASMAHPFHLHTNRFQVLERNGRPESLLAWKDTVSVGGYETVTIRVKFEDFKGRTVYHCHILDHEDQGMMGVLEII